MGLLYGRGSRELWLRNISVWLLIIIKVASTHASIIAFSSILTMNLKAFLFSLVAGLIFPLFRFPNPSSYYQAFCLLIVVRTSLYQYPQCLRGQPHDIWRYWR